jgi:hypothetical protein
VIRLAALSVAVRLVSFLKTNGWLCGLLIRLPIQSGPPNERQKMEFSRLVAFREDPSHCLRAKYSPEMRACQDPECPHDCCERLKMARRNPESAAACCTHEDCVKPFIGTAQFSAERGHYETCEERGSNVENLPHDPDVLDW